MRKRNLMMNVFFIPAMVLFAIFVVYPFLNGVRLSFTNWNGYSPHMKNIGLMNYKRMFTDKNVLVAFRNTLIYGFGSTLIQNVFGILLAVFLNSEFKGKNILRTIIYLPVMIAPLIMGYIMYFFFAYDHGAINDIIILFGGTSVDWLMDGNRAVIILMLINSFQFIGISMVIYLAGLQNIPKMYYEAAAIDGSNGFENFRYVTLPLLTPAITSAVTINLIGGFKLFDVISALTSGGPGYDSHSVSTLINKLYFGSESAGYASAVGLIFFLFIMIISYFVVRMLQRKQVEM